MAVFGPFGVLFKPCFSAKVDTFCPPARKKVYLFTCTLPNAPKMKKPTYRNDYDMSAQSVLDAYSRLVYMLWCLYAFGFYA